MLVLQDNKHQYRQNHTSITETAIFKWALTLNMSSTKQIGFFEGLDLFIDCKNVSYIYISAGTYHCSQVIAGGSIPKGMCNMASCVCRGDLIICGGETIRLV